MRGGIVRVRPDGTDLEIFATGLRNPFDIGIDPFMNLFTRDNDDNRAGGWDIRVSHLMQSAYYGYSQHYANFPDEIMPPLGQFGGGSGTGNLFLQDERWPEKYRNVLLTGDWGRSEVYRHELRRARPHLRPETGSVPEVPAADRASTWTAAAGSTSPAGAAARPASTSGRTSASSPASPRRG